MNTERRNWLAELLMLCGLGFLVYLWQNGERRAENHRVQAASLLAQNSTLEMKLAAAELRIELAEERADDAEDEASAANDRTREANARSERYALWAVFATLFAVLFLIIALLYNFGVIKTRALRHAERQIAAQSRELEDRWDSMPSPDVYIHLDEQSQALIEANTAAQNNLNSAVTNLNLRLEQNNIQINGQAKSDGAQATNDAAPKPRHINEYTFSTFPVKPGMRVYVNTDDVNALTIDYMAENGRGQLELYYTDIHAVTLRGAIPAMSYFYVSGLVENPCTNLVIRVKLSQQPVDQFTYESDGPCPAHK